MANNKNKNQAGFTLLELTVSLFVLVILIFLVIPSWQSILEHQRAKSAASALFLDLSLAKSESIKRNNRVRVTFMIDPNGSWCYGWKINGPCDCFAQTACTVNGIVLRQTNEKFPSVKLEPHISSPGDHLIFERTRLFIASTYGHIRIKTIHKEIRVIVSRTGRIRLCSPSGLAHVAGYSSIC